MVLRVPYTAVILLVAALVFGTAGCRPSQGPTRSEAPVGDTSSDAERPAAETLPDLSGKRVFYIDSYHPDYQHSIQQQSGALEILDAAGVETLIRYLDAKRHPDDPSRRYRAGEIRSAIERWQPDLILAADDYAQVDIIVPWFLGGSIPVVFSGVNGDPEGYGYTNASITGHLEVDPIGAIVGTLSGWAEGPRLGILVGDTLSDRQAVASYRERQRINVAEERYVRTMDEWIRTYRELQASMDMVILRSNIGIADWDDERARNTVAEYSRIPAGSIHSYMLPYVHITFMKDPREFGSIAGRAAVAVLSGRSPSEIPMAMNRRYSLGVNMERAVADRIVVPSEILRLAVEVIEP